MGIELKGQFSCHKLNIVANYIKEHLIEINSLTDPLLIHGVKITKTSKHKVLVELLSE